MKTLRIRIEGKVQGVWFRKHARDRAIELGLVGEVWNESDGSIQAEVKGEETQIESYLSWCHKGSPLSKVASVQVSHSEKSDWPNTFLIRH